MVRGRHHQRIDELHRPSSCQPCRSDRDYLGRRQPGRLEAHHIPTAARARLPSRQCAEEPRRGEGRYGYDLSAHDPGSRLCHAGLRSHRSRPFHRVRRFFARRARRTYRGLQFESRDHGGRGSARGAEGPIEGQCRRGRKESTGHRANDDRRQAHRWRDRLGQWPRRLVRGRGGEGVN